MKKLKYKLVISEKPYYEEVEGVEHTLTIKKTSFIIGIHKKDKRWIVSDIKSGLHLTSCNTTKKDVIEQATKRILKYGVRKTKRILKSATDIDTHINYMRGKDKENINRFNRIKKLNKVFGFNVPTCKPMITGKCSIDIIKLDNMLHVPENVSAKDFITNKYGKEVADEVNNLL